MKGLVLLAAIVLASFCVGTNSDLIVKLKTGYIKGIYGPKETRKFMGIPFAEPPVEKLRWSSPVEKLSWTGILETTKPPTPCPHVLIGIYTNEDCLYLNVYTPPSRIIGNQKLPVLFWIYGGGFILGDGYEYGLYDGDNFVRQENVILVTFNYRLGIFGTIAVDGIEGNYGFEDQRAALRWVKQNIEQFGGDPENVTIFGESAGAMSVGLHLTTSKSDGLFSKAILMSNPFGSHWKTRQEARGYGKVFSEKSGCAFNDVECLKNLPAWKVLAAQPVVPDISDKKLGNVLIFSPFIDGIDIIENPMKLLEEGKFKKVPIIVGTTRDETSFLESVLTPLRLIVDFPAYLFNYQFYKHHLKSIFKENAEKVLAKYPPHLFYEKNYQNFFQLTSAVMFTCPSWKVAKAISTYQEDCHYYELNLVPDYLPFGTCARNKVCHAVDLAYTFGKIPIFGSERKMDLLKLRKKADGFIQEDALPLMKLTKEEYVDLIEEVFGIHSGAILKCFAPKHDGFGNFENLASLEKLYNQKYCDKSNLSFDTNESTNNDCSIAEICEIFWKANFNGIFMEKNNYSSQVIKFSESEKKLIRFIFNKIASFASGKINESTSLQSWPKLNIITEEYISLEEPIVSKSRLRADECPFWDEIGYAY